MGLKICLTIVDTKGKLELVKKENYSNFDAYVKTENLAPKDIHITTYKDKVIILNESVNEIISESKHLNKIEEDINLEFPNCEIAHIVQYDSINMAGYVIIENGIKLRAKCVANDQLYLDDDNFSDFERRTLNTTKKAIVEAYPKIANKILEAIKDKTEKEELIYFLTFKNKLLKDNVTYYNGNYEIELIHKIIPYFIEGDWSKFTEFDYMKFKGKKLKDENLDIVELINYVITKMK